MKFVFLLSMGILMAGFLSVPNLLSMEKYVYVASSGFAKTVSLYEVNDDTFLEKSVKSLSVSTTVKVFGMVVHQIKSKSLNDKEKLTPIIYSQCQSSSGMFYQPEDRSRSSCKAYRFTESNHYFYRTFTASDVSVEDFSESSDNTKKVVITDKAPDYDSAIDNVYDLPTLFMIAGKISFNQDELYKEYFIADRDAVTKIRLTITNYNPDELEYTLVISLVMDASETFTQHLPDKLVVDKKLKVVSKIHGKSNGRKYILVLDKDSSSF